jgi:polyisoprenoid-binding protein YceI
MRFFSSRATLIAAALLATGAIAQAPMTVPGTPDPKSVTAGTYKVDPYHTQVVFAIDHMGFSVFRGFLSEASGTLVLDPAKPAATQLSVTIPMSSIHTTSAKLDGELVSPEWLDATAFPTATFVSTKVTPGPDGMAIVMGNLTFHGVTKPTEMRVRFHGTGSNPMSKAATIGFDGRLMLERSEFGAGKYVPLISDHVELTIAAAFEKQ